MGDPAAGESGDGAGGDDEKGVVGADLGEGGIVVEAALGRDVCPGVGDGAGGEDRLLGESGEVAGGDHGSDAGEPAGVYGDGKCLGELESGVGGEFVAAEGGGVGVESGGVGDVRDRT